MASYLRGAQVEGGRVRAGALHVVSLVEDDHVLGLVRVRVRVRVRSCGAVAARRGAAWRGVARRGAVAARQLDVEGAACARVDEVVIPG